MTTLEVLDILHRANVYAELANVHPVEGWTCLVVHGGYVAVNLDTLVVRNAFGCGSPRLGKIRKALAGARDPLFRMLDA